MYIIIIINYGCYSGDKIPRIDFTELEIKTWYVHAIPLCYITHDSSCVGEKYFKNRHNFTQLMPAESITLTSLASSLLVVTG